MLKVENGSGNAYKVLITRGDSASLKLTMADADGNTVELGDGDTAVLTVKKEICCCGEQKKADLQVSISEDGQFVFLPEDTANMEPGTYWFDIEVRLAGGDVYTIIPPSKLILARGVS